MRQLSVRIFLNINEPDENDRKNKPLEKKIKVSGCESKTVQIIRYSIESFTTLLVLKGFRRRLSPIKLSAIENVDGYGRTVSMIAIWKKPLYGHGLFPHSIKVSRKK